MAQQNPPGAWVGPSGEEMIASHTLAKEIIQRHGGPYPVFDDISIMELRKFTNDPSRAPDLLQDILSSDPAAGKNSLSAHIIASHGTDKPILTGNEIQALEEWFNNGGGKTAAELAA